MKTVTLHFGKPEQVDISTLEIPDLWHIAMLFKNAHDLYLRQQEVKKNFEYPDDNHELDKVIITINGASADKLADAILETWGIANDLKQNIIRDLIKDDGKELCPKD